MSYAGSGLDSEGLGRAFVCHSLVPPRGSTSDVGVIPLGQAQLFFC